MQDGVSSPSGELKSYTEREGGSWLRAQERIQGNARVADKKKEKE